MPVGHFRHDEAGSSAQLALIGRRLAWVREAVGLSQIELGRLIGADQSTITKWEKGTRLASVMHMVQVVELFGCSLDFIYCGRINDLMRRDLLLVLVAAHPEIVPPGMASELAQGHQGTGEASLL
jgi:transcriptional regulator with XRE-family HTH domain